MGSISPEAESPPRILLVDDSEILCHVLKSAFLRRGYEVECSHCPDSAMQSFTAFRPKYVVLDLRMEHATGLPLIPKMKAVAPDVMIVVVTGYGSVATAVEAIKLGAVHYLVKPANASEIEAAFRRLEGDADIVARENPLSVGRLEWEHIQKVMSDQNGNISAAARALGMHRRTLQRKLGKRPVAN